MENNPQERLTSILKKVNPLHDLMLNDKKISQEEHIKPERTDGQFPIKPLLSHSKGE